MESSVVVFMCSDWLFSCHRLRLVLFKVVTLYRGEMQVGETLCLPTSLSLYLQYNYNIIYSRMGINRRKKQDLTEISCEVLFLTPIYYYFTVSWITQTRHGA